MAQIMTKRGNQDNVVTYEFVCDTTTDLATIDPSYVTMGSIAIVIDGDSGFEVYIANSKKQWIALVTSSVGQEENPDSAVALEDGTILTDESGNVIGVDEPTT